MPIIENSFTDLATIAVSSADHYEIKSTPSVELLGSGTMPTWRQIQPEIEGLYHLKKELAGDSFQAIIYSEQNLTPFNELIISWASKRPVDGYLQVEVSLLVNDTWDDFLPYAEWGKDGQRSFKAISKTGISGVYQDGVEPKQTHAATGFKILITAHHGANLNDLTDLYVATCNSSFIKPNKPLPASFEDIALPVKGLSQMTVSDESRRLHICSPTSTTAVIRYLKNIDLDPLVFDDMVFDKESGNEGEGIHGNWVFATAAASSLGCPAWVQRLRGFGDILFFLQRGTPVVISVRGPLQGSASPYAQGHLLVVRGIKNTPQGPLALCMDPAFPSDEETLVEYPIEGETGLDNAWKRRGRIAYLFEKAN